MKTHSILKSIVLFAVMTIYYPFGYSQVFDHSKCGFTGSDEPAEEAKVFDCTNNSSDYIQKYRTPGHWKANSSTPVKTILINFIICLKDNGSGGWPDTPYTHNRLADLIQQVNDVYSSIPSRPYPLTCPPVPDIHVLDSKIRFELNEVIFLYSTTFNNLPLTNPQPILDYVYANHPSSKNALNHVFTLPPNTGPWGIYGNYGGMPYVHTEQSMSVPDPAFSFHHEHVAHEYAHALGLLHNYPGFGQDITEIDHYDFLDDVFGTCPEPYQMSCQPCTPPSGHICPFTCFYDQFIPPLMVTPLMGGRGKNYYISPKSAGRMHRAVSLIESTFNHTTPNIHKCVKEKYSYPVPKEITATETWDFAIKMYQDIVVKAGNTLTIKCKVYMPIGGKIIVEQGAKLVIDGGRITCAHDGLWQGIQVWGDNTQNQSVIAGYSSQGILQLINGAILEHATEAVVLFNPNAANTNGGIIFAKSSTFRNNVRAVRFNPYRNFINGGNPSVLADQLPNRSNFVKCIFETTENLPANQSFNTFISMWNVTGIKIRGCTFTNSNPNAPTINSLGTGIYALDANFTVTYWCTFINCPESIMTKSQFNNLHVGIRSEKSMANQPFTAEYSIFNNNVAGIVNSGMSGSKITSNQFIVGGNSKSNSGTIQIGLNIANLVQSITCEGNSFKKTVSPPSSGPNSFGTWIHNTGPYENKIYRNSFVNLHIGNLASGINKWTSFDEVTPGLHYNCNTNTGNTADFYVMAPPLTQPNPQFHGIRPFQGVNLSPAGNTFTSGGQSFVNLVSTPVAYYYGSTPQAFPTYTINTYPYPAIGTNNCLSTLVMFSMDNLQKSIDTLELDQQIDGLNSVDEGIDHELQNQLLSSDGLPQSEYEIVMNYIGLGDWEKANDVLSKIQTQFDLSGFFLEDYFNFSLYAKFCIRVLSEGKLNQLSDADINELRKIAELGSQTGSQRAKSILAFFYGDQYENQIELTLAELNESLSIAKKETLLLLYPNPSDNELTIKLLSNQEDLEGSITIVDPLGKTVFETSVLNAETVVNTSSWSNGTYLVKYTNKLGILVTQKLMIQHD